MTLKVDEFQKLEANLKEEAQNSQNKPAESTVDIQITIDEMEANIKTLKSVNQKLKSQLAENLQLMSDQKARISDQSDKNELVALKLKISQLEKRLRK